MAHFEIHVLNYNGVRFLERCLTSLQLLDTGQHRVHVNVVDNGSTDNSEHFVKSKFPEVSFIALGENLGFSEGNNRGAWIAASRLQAEFGRPQDYDVFLNNDTEVSRDWLIKAASVLESEPDVGIVGSKALFMDRFIPLRIKVTPAFVPASTGSADSRILGCFINTPLIGSNLKTETVRFRWKGSFHPESGGRWVSPECTILIPVEDPALDSELNLTLRFASEHAKDIKIEFFLDDSHVPFRVCNSHAAGQLNCRFSFSKNDYISVIQNMGNFITPEWEAGDLCFGEAEHSQKGPAREVSAVCGVSLFIRHKLFKQLKGFDGRYFAYFEDTDLSVRTYLAGYKCKVVPESVLYHIHCGSSGGEWSPTFSRLVAFSHLLFTNKFAPKQVWLKRLTELKRASKEQFEVYLQTKDLNTTPQFRAYLSYLKKPHVFQVNRIKQQKNSDKLSKYPFCDKNGALISRG